jgi:hypothetical protein
LIIKESFEYVHKKYEAEAIEKARKNGKEDEKREIAKKLKSILPPKEISRITGLSINAILLL